MIKRFFSLQCLAIKSAVLNWLQWFIVRRRPRVKRQSCRQSPLTWSPTRKWQEISYWASFWQ